MTETIGERLEYFQELEQATRMLNHPGESLVLQTDFLYMVERVDICIDYLKSHASTTTIPRMLQLTLHPTLAILQRGRGVSAAFPTMHDSCNDVDQDVFRRLSPCAGRRCDQEDIGEGVPQFICLIALSIHTPAWQWRRRTYRQRRRCTFCTPVFPQCPTSWGPSWLN